MAFEYRTSAGIVRLARTQSAWTIQFRRKRRVRWSSPDAATSAAAEHLPGLPQGNAGGEPVSRDIIDWRPIGESI